MKVILFGGGYWGRNYVRELGSHLVGVVEPSEEAAIGLKRDFNVEVWPVMPTDVLFDGAIVATPPDLHIPIARPLLEAGKYVLIEKPLAHSVDEMKDLRSERCMAGLVYLYHPAVHMLKEMYDNHDIGIHAFSRRTNNGPVRTWKNAMWDLAPHDVSIFNYIVGGVPKTVYAHSERSWAQLVLIYEEVIPLDAYIYVSWAGGPKIRQVEFLSLTDSFRVIYDDVEESAALVHTPLRAMINDFLSGDWDYSKASFDAGREVVEVLERAEKYESKIC